MARIRAQIHGFLDAVIGLRKLFFSIGALAFIGTGLLIVLGVFIANWKLGTNVISGDNFADIVVAGFQYASVVVSAYLAVNVANKWVSKWLERKKK